MNQHLQTAFEQVARGREALNDIRQDPGFHNETWEQAIVSAFDHIEALKMVSHHDAATLGLVYCQLIGTLIDRLMEEESNTLTLGTICMILDFAGAGLSTAKRFFEYALQDLEEAQEEKPVPVFYTVKMDSVLPYAFVLTPEASLAEKREGFESARELHEHMRDTFGADIQVLPASKFQQELEKRMTHTPEVATLLQQNGELLGQDLSRHIVYGSYNRPMNSLWARVDAAAVYIQVDKQTTGYHSYVAVPCLLDAEILERYELKFVSHP